MPQIYCKNMKSIPRNIQCIPVNGSDTGHGVAWSLNQVRIRKNFPHKETLQWNAISTFNLSTVGMDPLKFDFSAEWSKFWLRRLRELYEDEIALKKFEIRKKLQLSPDYYPRSSSSSSSYNKPSSSSSFGYNKDEGRMEKSRIKSQYSSDPVKEDHVDDEPITVISVLRLLAALEDLLGATLGKKVLDLLSKAVHLEKLKANLADDVLMNEENSVLLDTVKEKLKGLLIAKIVNNQQINAVRRAIRNVESIVAVIDKKLLVSEATDPVQSKSDNKMSVDTAWTDKQNLHLERRDDSRIEISKQIATAFLIQKINISTERLEELTDTYASQARESSETPYLFGVRVSQNEFDYSAKSQNSSSHSQSSSLQPQKKPQNSTDGGSGFAFTLFDTNARNTRNSDNSTFNSTVNSANSSNFLNRSNSLGDTYSQHNTSQSMTNSNQSNQQFRSPDQFHQQNASHQSSFSKPLSQPSNQHQRFQSQNSSTAHQPTQNASNKHMHKKNHYNQSNNQRKQTHLPIWESETMMANQSQSQGFEKNAKINSIWDTNPMQSQNQNQQQFNQGSYQQGSKQPQQSHFNNFYQQNQHGSQQPIWNHQFSQQQNNRNSRHH